MSGVAWAGAAVSAIIVVLAVVGGWRKSGVNRQRPHTAEEVHPGHIANGATPF